MSPTPVVQGSALTVTVLVRDRESGQPVTDGSIQFQRCVPNPSNSDCTKPNSFRNFGDPIALDPSGSAVLTPDTSQPGSYFMRFKYLPGSTGYKGHTSTAQLVVITPAG